MTDKINFPKITIEKEIPNETLEQIRQIVPDVLEDGKVNCKKLNEVVGEMLVDPDEPEHFGLNWPGKRQSIKLARTPSKQTLIPVPGDGVDEDKTQNLFIEGENMEVLKLLQKSYAGKIKMIYIDPPYNTGYDFIYNDKFSESEKTFLESTGQISEEGIDMISNKKSSGRFHSNWLSMIYTRIKLAKGLLSEDGVIFISIGEDELPNLSLVMREIFGEENDLAIITRVAKTASDKGSFFAPSTDYLLAYTKDVNVASLFSDKVNESLYKKVETEGERKGERYRDDVALYQSGLIGNRPNCRYYISCPDGSKVIPPVGKFWRWGPDTLNNNIHLLVFRATKTSPLLDEDGGKAKWNIYVKSYLTDREKTGTSPRNFLTEFINRKGKDYLKKLDIPFDYAKPMELIQWLIDIIQPNNGDVILDFFSGSGTTGEAVMRKMTVKLSYILVQIPEKTPEDSEAFKAGYKNIAEIAKERIRRAGKKIKEETKKEIDYGFKVFKLQKESNIKDESEMFGMTDQLTLESAEENLSSLRKDWTKEKLLTEILLIEGFPLISTIEKAPITTNEVLIVTSSFEDRPDKLVVCLDSEINRATIDNLPVGELDNFIFLESSLPEVGGDEIKQILHEKFKSRIKVI